ncbi:MAG: murein transglycosylase A [Kiloniellaceae bacterium]
MAACWARIMGRAAIVGAVALGLGACEKKVPPEAPPALVLGAVEFEDLPGWAEDDVAAAVPALLRSCARLTERGENQGPRPRGARALAGGAADWRAPCAAVEAAKDQGAGAARAAIEAWFVPFRARNGRTDSGLVTGYYEAELKGALFPGAQYSYPIYGLPEDLVVANLGRFDPALAGRRIVGRVDGGRLRPYLTRDDIEDGVLGGRNLELLWADDPVDVFVLHIQGSGMVRFPDGSARRIGFAASNGHAFTGIGRILLDEGKVAPGHASMQEIRAWLRAHPREAARYMRRNARYIFFRWIDGDGPIGAHGVALTAGRSLAVDPAFVPFGLPIYLDTTWPGEKRPLRRLMVAQDAGAAIKGPLRADFFWGTGEAALEYAGRMKQRARFFILLPKAVAARRAATS